MGASDLNRRSLVISIPIISARCLSPNSRCYFREKARDVAGARAIARLATADAITAIGGFVDPGGPIRLEWTRHLSYRQRQTDIDNAIAVTKPYTDGVADRLGIDDRRITEIAMKQERAIDGNAAYTLIVHFLDG